MCSSAIARCDVCDHAILDYDTWVASIGPLAVEHNAWVSGPRCPRNVQRFRRAPRCVLPVARGIDGSNSYLSRQLPERARLGDDGRA